MKITPISSIISSVLLTVEDKKVYEAYKQSHMVKYVVKEDIESQQRDSRRARENSWDLERRTLHEKIKNFSDSALSESRTFEIQA